MIKKLIVILIFFSLILLFSYSKNNKNFINYTLLGDKESFSNNIMSKNYSDLIYDELYKRKIIGFYNKSYIKEDIRIIDLLNSIKDNEKIEDVPIQNIIKKSNLIIISIGNNEIDYKLSKIDEDSSAYTIYSYLDEVEKDYILLLNTIKKYNNSNIIVLGFYNKSQNPLSSKYYKYINNKVKNYCNSNKIIYINTYQIYDKKNDIKNTSYVSNDTNISLFNKIYSKIDKLYLHKIH